MKGGQWGDIEVKIDSNNNKPEQGQATLSSYIHKLLLKSKKVLQRYFPKSPIEEHIPYPWFVWVPIARWDIRAGHVVICGGNPPVLILEQILKNMFYSHIALSVFNAIIFSFRNGQRTHTGKGFF